MSFDQAAPAARSFTVLAVCTGNICRSPAVERLLAAQLGAGSGVVVTSAGVSAVVGASIPAQMASLVRAAGVSTEGFAARQLTEEMLRTADVVLALTKGHRSKIVGMHPAGVWRTFTVRELARLGGGVELAALPAGTAAERFAALIPLVAAKRGLLPVGSGEDDVVDPWGGDGALYRRAFNELAPAVEKIARVVLG